MLEAASICKVSDEANDVAYKEVCHMTKQQIRWLAGWREVKVV